MAEMQPVWSNFEACIRIKDDEIGIMTRRDLAFLLLQTSEMGRIRAHPAGDVFESEAAVASSSPNRRKCDGQRGDAAPGSVEVASIQLLQVGRARRMIGRDQIENT